MNNLEVVIQQNLGVINFNFEEMKAGINGIVSAYEGAVVMEESIPAAKKEIASLRKMQKALSDRRIEVKKAFMQPYDDFDSRVKELTALIDKPVNLIDGQIKDFEEQQKAEKKKKIEYLYTSLVGDLQEFLPLDKIYNPKWENKTVSLKDAEEEMCTVMSSTKSAIEAIQAMNSECTQAALEIYKTDLSLNNAIVYITKYETQKAEIVAREAEKRKAEEESKREAEVARIRREERDRVAEEQRIRDEERKKAIDEMLSVKAVVEPGPIPTFTDEEDLEAPFDAEPLEWITPTIYEIAGTDDELRQVEMYMNSIGVEWRLK
ncbi:DUF1351 domain-containing protein [Parasporobacterium paucivorans]|uniref:DUF1351 domain-containing protein n=1 Tax=Parasporobacterium paucivorans DSM 15970 TaxID=1122934 RepID=A0A1M6B6I4_9FIRM|nr:DUF1351 domain-containing protein [Parasporobacterium paucivorans]SHI44290.1 Protein of unknown function [Parasporobacterium paucivorans DSM 15970]